ncbi:MAG: 2-polyprenyl-3-methyl-6-methoxy-1,4-benzoquinone monooxygenase [Rhodocyclaceae bacterium]|jgi:ubiquinone biosynthesis monooxygenase Coq7|nr:2-polyprenyl-3-methyl-6-methoxy-1,4-benzoquinone monooxygenase [Rhodocyclaceae bacterium]
MSCLDPLIFQVDQALRTLFAKAPTTRQMPGAELPETEATEAQRRHVAALMRVNHVGEVCAQALYAGQAFTARERTVQQALVHAAWEETEHLNWTENRIAELGGRKSMLNPVWYAGAWTIGAVAGCLGDHVSLGFLAETERQVEAHLDGHLDGLPESDRRSRAIVQQMKLDEIKHAETAIALGAAELPGPAKGAMKLAAKLMTGTAYWV